MPVVRQHSARLPITALLPIFDSLGAHLASKLEHFGTDERTLTDELCDMFMIWCQEAPHGNVSLPRSAAALGAARLLEIQFSKTTQQEEATIGADLSLRVASPSGIKRALIQAKVFDPRDDRLRCDSPTGWDKLWSQLVLMRQHNGDLSFLLVYVPGSKLDGQTHGFGTWEQGAASPTRSPTSSRFGATLISVDALISSSGSWLHAPPIRHVGNGRFLPSGFSLRRLLLDILTCRQGRWLSTNLFDSDGVTRDPDRRDAYPVRFLPYRELGLSFAENSEEQWRSAIDQLQEDLRDEDTSL